MILPIVAYGDPVLKKETKEIQPGHEGLQELIENMFETMYNASGVGLAAPQVGQSLRMFIVDASPFADDGEEFEHLRDFKKVFINPFIVDEEGDDWGFEEGCLSIPTMREEVFRQPKITLEYQDENFEMREEVFEGFAARVIQHEHDHVDGILFTDHLSPLKKRMIKGKLKDIAQGNVDVAYKMKFPLRK
jgi:peptide deformylase